MDLHTFASVVTEGHDVLRTAVAFADARVDAIRTIHHYITDSGVVETRNRFRFGVGLRVLSANRWGFVVQEGNLNWRDAIRHASHLTHILPSRECSKTLAPMNRLERMPNDDQKAQLSILPAESVHDLFCRIVAAVPKVKSVKVRYFAESGWRGVVSSEGTKAIRPLSRSHLTVTISVRSSGGRLISIPFSDVAITQEDLVAKIWGRIGEIQQKCQQIRSAAAARPQRCPVVLGPSLAALFIHEAFGHLCEADRVPDERASSLPRGLIIGPHSLEIWDRSDIPGTSATMEFDDEGVLCKAVQLVAEGRWIGLLHSRSTAPLYNEDLTGNARVTSFRFMPFCRMRLTEVKSDKTHPDELVSEIQEGLYLDHPYGGHIRAAQFCLPALNAWRIHSGKLAEPLAGVFLSGQPLAVLRQIDRVGSDQRIVDNLGGCSRDDQRDLPVSMACPSIRLREVQIEPL